MGEEGELLRGTILHTCGERPHIKINFSSPGTPGGGGGGGAPKKIIVKITSSIKFLLKFTRHTGGKGRGRGRGTRNTRRWGRGWGTRHTRRWGRGRGTRHTRRWGRGWGTCRKDRIVNSPHSCLCLSGLPGRPGGGGAPGTSGGGGAGGGAPGTSGGGGASPDVKFDLVTEEYSTIQSPYLLLQEHPS